MQLWTSSEDRQSFRQTIVKLTEQSSGTKAHYNAIHQWWLITENDKTASWEQLLGMILHCRFFMRGTWESSGSSYFVWLQFIPVVISSCQHLLAKGDNISRVVLAPMLMSPELACCSSTCLHLIHVESTAVLKEPDTDKHLSAHSLSKPILSARIKLHTTPAGHSRCALLRSIWSEHFLSSSGRA